MRFRRKRSDDLTALKDTVAALRRDLNAEIEYHVETSDASEARDQALRDEIAALREQVTGTKAAKE